MELSWNIPGSVQQHQDWKQNNSTADPPHSWDSKSRFNLFVKELSWHCSCVTMQFSHLLPVSFAWYRPGNTCLTVLLSSYVDYTRNLLQLYSIFRTNSCPHVLIISGKGNVHGSVQSQDKQKSKVMSPLEKVEAFNQRNREWEVVLLDGVSELIIHSMKKNENKSWHVNASAPSSAKMSCIRHFYPFLQKWKWPCGDGGCHDTTQGEDQQKVVKQSKITCFFTKSSVSPPSCTPCHSHTIKSRILALLQ